jgi:methionyl-tRNA formyltransferase
MARSFRRTLSICRVTAFLNVHASLLPKYRGAAPIQWAIANGETHTGVTIMQIDAGLDTGDMLLKAALTIGPSETAPELSARLAP